MRESLNSGIRRWTRAAAMVLVCSMLAAAASTKKVLILQSHVRGFEPHSTVSGWFQQELAEQSPDAIEFYEFFLPPRSDTGNGRESAFIEYLKSFEADKTFDLAVSLGAPATDFLQENRARLFPRTPHLVMGTEQRRIRADSLLANDAAVPIRVDGCKVMEGILGVLPETTDIIVVVGASPLERFWAAQFKLECQAIARRVKLTYTSDLPFSEVMKRAAAAPPRTAILFALMVTDAAGVPHRGDSALVALRGVARAPIFGIYESQLGKGVVGGSLIPVRAVSREAVKAALEILRGEAPSGLRLPPIGSGAPVFDARELARWRIDESRLPAGSTILFRQPTFWQAYKGRVIGIAALCLGEASLIFMLLLNLRRRRAAEVEVHSLSRRLVAAQEEERTRLARELHDDVTQRLARLAIDAGRLAPDVTGNPDRQAAGEMRDELVRLSDDVHTLAYRLHPSLLEDLGLAEALQAECERFAAQTSIPIELTVRDLPDVVPDDVSLCLFRVAQESLRNLGRHARARSGKVSLTGANGGIRLTVHDDGVGVDVSRARNRPSLGIASMRERVHMFGGKFEFESRPGEGATVRAFVPLREEPT